MTASPSILADEFVLDASVALAWGFEDEHDPLAEAILDRLPATQAVAPATLLLEVANALLVGERRGRLTQADVAQFVELLDSLPVTLDDETSERALWEILTLAREQNLSAYEAAYLDLAMRHGLPLATLDQRLRGAAAAVGVALYAVP
ncbi:MAG: type II toxin-antitoxin system VapC family toxin [Dehalococcoidia bacterium]